MGARRRERNLTIDSKEWLDAWNGPSAGPILATMDPEVEVIAVTLGIEGRRYVGHEGVRQWMRDIAERFSARTVADTLTQLADDALMMSGSLWIDDGYGGEREQKYAMVVHLRADRAIWIGTFVSTGDARAAFEGGLTGPRAG